MLMFHFNSVVTDNSRLSRSSFLPSILCYFFIDLNVILLGFLIFYFIVFSILCIFLALLLMLLIIVVVHFIDLQYKLNYSMKN